MALAPPILLTLEDAIELAQRKAVVSSAAAHKFLKRLRAQHTVPPAVAGHLSGFTEECIAISSAASQGEFDWKGYVANRSVEQLELVVGDGITCFEARFLAALDKNMKQNRFDFVAHRRDGSCVRFHPSARKDALPVYGNLQDWALTADARPLESKRIAVPVQVPGASRGSSDVYETLSQADIITTREVLVLLHMHEHIWRGEGGKFATDLDVGKLAKRHFRYNMYLAGTSWGREIARIGVTSFWVVWVGRRTTHVSGPCQTSCGTFESGRLVPLPHRRGTGFLLESRGISLHWASRVRWDVCAAV